MKTDQRPKVIALDGDNLHLWPAFQKLLDYGKIKVDRKGRLRYSHGAPVGKLILVAINKDGDPVYHESAEEWFDPDSQTAREFFWPD